MWQAEFYTNQIFRMQSMGFPEFFKIVLFQFKWLHEPHPRCRMAQHMPRRSVGKFPRVFFMRWMDPIKLDMSTAQKQNFSWQAANIIGHR